MWWGLSIWAFHIGGRPPSYNVCWCVFFICAHECTACVCVCVISSYLRSRPPNNQAHKHMCTHRFFAHLRPSSSCPRLRLSWFPECRWWSRRSRPSRWSPPRPAWRPQRSLRTDNATAQTEGEKDTMRGIKITLLSNSESVAEILLLLLLGCEDIPEWSLLPVHTEVPVYLAHVHINPTLRWLTCCFLQTKSKLCLLNRLQWWLKSSKSNRTFAVRWSVDVNKPCVILETPGWAEIQVLYM